MFYILSKYSFPKAVIPILHSFLSLRVSAVCVYRGQRTTLGISLHLPSCLRQDLHCWFTVHTQATWLKSSGKFSCSMCHRGCEITDVSYNIWLYTCTWIQTQVLTIVQQAPSPLSHLLSPPSVSFLVTKSLQLSRSLIAFDVWFSHFCHPSIQGIIMWFKYFFRQCAQEGYCFPMPRTVIMRWPRAAGRMVVKETHSPAEKPLTTGVLSQIQSPLDF